LFLREPAVCSERRESAAKVTLGAGRVNAVGGFWHSRVGITPVRRSLRAARASAPDNLRDALVSHAHDLSNGLHGQTLAVSRAYRFVPLLPEVFGGLLQRCFAPGVVLGEGNQACSGLRGLAFRAGYLRIV
jgi:hypothetical protein